MFPLYWNWNWERLIAESEDDLLQSEEVNLEEDIIEDHE